MKYIAAAERAVIANAEDANMAWIAFEDPSGFRNVKPPFVGGWESFMFSSRSRSVVSTHKARLLGTGIFF